MIEPEVAFNDWFDNMELAEGLFENTRFDMQWSIAKDDLQLLADRLEQDEKQLPQDKRSMPLMEKT